MPNRYVNLSTSTTDISGAQTSLLRLNFPASGGIQGVDATGAVFSLVSSTGSIIPSADNVDDLGSLALRWRGGYFGSLGVDTPLVAYAGVQALSINTSPGDTNRLNLTTNVGAGGPLLSAVGSATNIPFLLSGKGTGGVNLRNAASTITVLGVQNVSSTFFGVAVENAAASTAGGNVTIDAVSGRFRIAAAGTAVTITNNRVLDANSIVLLSLRQNDTTLLQATAIATGGSFTVTGNAAATANVDIDFIVINRAT